MNTEYDFDDVLILPNRSNVTSRNDVKLERKFQFYYSPKQFNCIPIIASNMLTTGTVEVAKILRKYKIITCLHKYYTPQELETILRTCEETYVWISIGLNELDKVRYLSYLSPNIVIDVPNGYIQSLPDYCAKVRDLSPKSIITCGNVCTLDMCQELILHGKVDIVKTGIGSGENCTTRLLTGVGRPQLSTILDCRHVHGLKSAEHQLGLLTSDGGIKNPGDIAKAFCAGADFVMIGGLIAGTEESGNDVDWVKKWGKKKYLKHYGMSTHYAQLRAGLDKKYYRASEGRITHIKNKGPLENLVSEIFGGLRSCGAYIGASSIKEFSRCATFTKVNRIHSNTQYNIGDCYDHE